MKALIRKYNPIILILLETKISGELATAVCRQLMRSHWIRSEASGFKGGIWVLWNDLDIQVQPRYLHQQFIHMSVVSAGAKHWDLTAIYASPQASSRNLLWSALDQLPLADAWVLLGDFNCVLRGDERSSGVGVSSQFVDWVEQRRLIDLGFSGPTFTWNYGTSMSTRRAARLDRVV